MDASRPSVSAGLRDLTAGVGDGREAVTRRTSVRDSIRGRAPEVTAAQRTPDNAVAPVSVTPADYVKNGWALVPVSAGKKGPTTPSWNKREKCLTDPERAARLDGNFGIAHAYSGTCAIDFDDLEEAISWLQSKGIDARKLLSAPGSVRITSGRPNRAKLLYRLETPLPTRVFANGALEFRCASRNGTTQQDLLPPSIHPDTGQAYRWEFGDPLMDDWRLIPPIPSELLALWQDELARSVPQSHREILASRHADFDTLRRQLKAQDPDCDYHQWIRVGMMLHHATGGSDAGLELWDEWSSKSRTKYKGRDDLIPHWGSFRLDVPSPVTAASLRVETPAIKEEFDACGFSSSVERGARFTVVPDNQFVDREPITWLIKGVLPKAELAVIYGASASGKSFLVLDMAAAIATGRDWNGRKTTKGRVLIVVAEGASGYRNRLLAHAQQHEGKFPGIKIIADTPNLHSSRDHSLVAKEIEASGGADLIVVDTLAAASAGADENSGEDMGTIIENCKQLHKATGALVLLVHHSGKDESRGARGWSGLKAATDAEIEVTRLADTRVATITKLKDGDDGAKFAFRLVRVEVGTDADSDPMTSCVVQTLAEVPTPARTKEPKPGTTERVVLDIVRNDLSFDGNRLAVSAIVDAAFNRLLKPEGRDTRRQHAKRALQTLAAKGFIAIEGDECIVL